MGVRNRSCTFAVDTSRSPYAKLRPVPIESVHLKDAFWAPRLRALREVTLPLQYQMLEETGHFFNFRRATRKETGSFQGRIDYDVIVYRWLEAVAFSLASVPDKKLRNLARQVIAQIVAAQDEDGYLVSYFIFDHKIDRWKSLGSKELICAGHLMHAATAFYQATGERALLEAACHFADHIANIFGPGKRLGAPSAPQIEMALVDLYRITGNKDYMQLAKFFIDNRGKGLIGDNGDIFYKTYGQYYYVDHKPFRELTEIVGHAVRALILNCGAAEVYMETGEQALWDALISLWHSMIERKMYVTGGVGSRYEGEAFGDDYELPNGQAYAETCAAVANVMWNWRMLLISGETRFADIMELALYNGALSGISLDGKHYFYVNPLMDRAQPSSSLLAHVWITHHRRQRWLKRIACCPPYIARLLASLPGYFYSLSTEGIWMHLYAQSTSHLELDGKSVNITQHTNYPWEGEVEIFLHPRKEMPFSLHLRIPGWCKKAEVQVNGKRLEAPIRLGHYVEVNRSWKVRDRVRLSLSMPVERIVCHNYVIENNDRVALKRGPIVYCIEQVDNPDFDVWNLMLPADAPLEVKWMPDLLNGINVIKGEALAVDVNDFKDYLYRPMTETSYKLRRVQFNAIPYYAWANREPGPMSVWIRSLGHLQNYQAPTG